MTSFDRRQFLKLLGLSGLVATVPFVYSCSTSSTSKNQWKHNPNSIKNPDAPNIIFILADQFRKQAIGGQGEDPTITPHLNKLALNSCSLSNAFSSASLCSPYRATLMTGRFPLSTGVVTNIQPGLDLELKNDEICIAEVLKESGYATGYIGKWHLDMPSRNKTENPIDKAEGWDTYTPPGPKRRGFDFWYAHNVHKSHFHPHYWRDTPEKIVVNQWSVDHETDIAIDLIKERPDKNPFCLFLSWNPPHPPFVAPEQFKDLYKNIDFKPRENELEGKVSYEDKLGYFGAVSSCDDNIGRIIKTLTDENILDNTILIFTADHGEMLGSHGRMGKNIWYEESIGVPFIISWPKKIKSRTCNALFMEADIMPTLLSLAGLSIPKSVEGTDVSESILHGKVGRESIPVYSYVNPGDILAVGQEPTNSTKIWNQRNKQGIDWKNYGFRGIRTEDHCYVIQNNIVWKTPGKMLFDIKNDPYQLNPKKNNQIKPDEESYFHSELKTWLEKMNDPFIKYLAV